MPPPLANSHKIEELRFRIKTDPKSRLFFPLAEELRKAGQVAEAEQVLRTGLAIHTTYLSGWVSLGRVLRDQKKDAEAVDVLNKALQIDPGNVVAARLLADAYLSVGEKVEAIKKYKLVHALLPSDEELEGLIDRLQDEINAPVPFMESQAQEEAPAEAEAQAVETEDVEPMLAAHAESPFEEPLPDSTAAALEVEEPQGFSIEAAPLVAEVPAPVEEAFGFAEPEPEPVLEPEPVALPESEPEPEPEPEPIALAPEPIAEEADVFAPLATTETPFPEVEDLVVPQPEEMPAAAATSSRNPSVDRLEQWLARVSRREVGRV